MPHEGKYIYGIIATDAAPNFGPIGIGGMGNEVVTIGTNGLAAVVSDSSMEHYVLSKEHLSAHTRVVEKVAESFTVLPMRFCTVAESSDEVINFLEANSRQLKNFLKDMEGKVEIGVKIFWKNMKKIYEEIAKENRAIKGLKKDEGTRDQQSLVRAGQMVQAALEEKRAVEGDEYLRVLRKVAMKHSEGECNTEDMVANASFLVDRDWIKEFDNRIEQIGKEHDERIHVKYVGPMPPFSFVNLEMHWGR